MGTTSDPEARAIRWVRNAYNIGDEWPDDRVAGLAITRSATRDYEAIDLIAGQSAPLAALLSLS
jgi:hypothetical protein